MQLSCTDGSRKPRLCSRTEERRAHNANESQQLSRKKALAVHTRSVDICTGGRSERWLFGCGLLEQPNREPVSPQKDPVRSHAAECGKAIVHLRPCSLAAKIGDPQVGERGLQRAMPSHA